MSRARRARRRDNRSSHSAHEATLAGTCILRLYARSINLPVPRVSCHQPLYESVFGDLAHAPLRKVNYIPTLFGLIREFLTVQHRIEISSSTSGAPIIQRLESASPPHLKPVPNSWHMIGRTSPHMQESLVPSATSDSSVSPKPHSSTIIMEAREGRSGNAFACERCKRPTKLCAHFLTLTGRKHKVRCVPSDTASICQRYVFRHFPATSG